MRSTQTLCFLLSLFVPNLLSAATLTVELRGGEEVTFVGAFHRWDQDGNPREKVNPKATIDVPEVDAAAVKIGPNRWVFRELPKGRHDLVILGRDRVRIEGWEYAPVLEFAPFFPPAATTEPETREFIVDDIGKSRHYENKVVPLAMGGREKAVRVLVMLIRDLPTSHTPGAGTMRFEIWQYTSNYGVWVKEKRTRVMHRVLLPVSELRRWTWGWEPKLGGIQVDSRAVTVKYEVPTGAKLKGLPGLHPY